MSRHLLLAPGRGGMGEVRLGVEIARGLAARGDAVTMLVHPAFAALFDGLGLDVRRTVPEPTPAERVWITPQSPSPLERQIRAVAAEIRPTALGLVDWVQCFEALMRHRCSPRLPTSLGVPFWTLDTWDFASFPPPEPGEPLLLDISDGEQIRVLPAIASFPRRLVPVPFARPDAEGGFRVLPDPVRRDVDTIVRTRRALGVPTGAPTVLLCTAGWQHRQYEGRNAAAARSVPDLLALHLRRLPADVHLVHLGPEVFPALASALGDRHHRSPSLPVPAFEDLLCAVDVVVSLNASATTNLSAASADRPVVCLINDHEAGVDGLAAHLGRPVDPEVSAWASANLPLPAFRMWPLSMARALSHVLRDNPWTPLLHPTPVLDAVAVSAALEGLLGDAAVRDADRERRARYVDRVRTLPTGAELLGRLLEAA